MKKPELNVLPISTKVKFIGTDVEGMIVGITIRGVNSRVEYDVTYWQDGRKSVWAAEEELEPLGDSKVLKIGFKNG